MLSQWPMTASTTGSASPSLYSSNCAFSITCWRWLAKISEWTRPLSTDDGRASGNRYPVLKCKIRHSFLGSPNVAMDRHRRIWIGESWMQVIEHKSNEQLDRVKNDNDTSCIFASYIIHTFFNDISREIIDIHSHNNSKKSKLQHVGICRCGTRSDCR